MIIGNINDCEKCCCISDKIGDALHLLKAIEYGKNTSDITVNFAECATSDEEENGEKKVFEAHKKYIDIHYIFEGAEQFGYANVNTLSPITEYDENDDYILLDGEVNRITLYKGDFVIAFPEDAHIPMMKYKSGGNVKRAVVKIPV